MSKINKYVKDAFTEKNGKSICPVRVLFILGAILYIALTLRDSYLSPDAIFLTHANDWISGFGQYIGFGGSAVAAKNFTESGNDS